MTELEPIHDPGRGPAVHRDELDAGMILKQGNQIAAEREDILMTLKLVAVLPESSPRSASRGGKGAGRRTPFAGGERRPVWRRVRGRVRGTGLSSGALRGEGYPVPGVRTHLT